MQHSHLNRKTNKDSAKVPLPRARGEEPQDCQAVRLQRQGYLPEGWQAARGGHGTKGVDAKRVRLGGSFEASWKLIRGLVGGSWEPRGGPLGRPVGFLREKGLDM